ncbi:hypothetical protein [Microcoleus sp. EPA2]|uniref:hypothetical protein n=1 Tax=Microcoleus sp. EPA2 TaxID=2841654 RepID=UPI00312B817B
MQLHYACGVVAIAIPAKTQQQIDLGLSCFFSTKGDRLFGISQNVRSPFPPLSQKRAIYLLNSTSVRSLFWLRIFLQERAIALHLYQMPNLRSPLWNKSKRAIAFLVWKGRSHNTI